MSPMLVALKSEFTVIVAGLSFDPGIRFKLNYSGYHFKLKFMFIYISINIDRIENLWHKTSIH
jgi:hypothetical protein